MLSGEPSEAAIGRLIGMVHEATAPVTGGDYFRTLVTRLATSLGVDKALVTECLSYPENHVRTLAFWEDDHYAEDITFDLTGTPCQDVIGDARFCFFPDRMQELFPEWAGEEGGIQSFIGIPVLAPSDGRIVGHIAVYDRSPMVENQIVESMFRIVAARVGAEIERMQAETALRDSEERARQHLSQLAHTSRVSALGELASALAHEVNQPLTAILTYCRTCEQLLNHDDVDPDTLRHALRRSIASAEHAATVLAKLRQYVQRGEVKLHLIPASVLLQDCRLLLETEARHHHVRLEFDIDDKLPNIRVDAVLLQQVVLNIARNGIDAINSSDNEERRIGIRAEPTEDDQLIVCFTDTGGGVDEDIRDRLFEPFNSRRKDGLGIGLSLCRSILENHAGRLWLETTGDRGSTFCFSLPTEPSPPAE